MMVAQNMLDLLRCPATGETLLQADDALLKRVNDLIDAGGMKNRLGETVAEKIDAGLKNQSQTLLCPIRGDIVTLIADELIELNTVRV